MNEKTKRNIIFCCGSVLIFVAALLLIPSVQSLLLHIGESFLGRELRRPEKWIGLFRKYSVFLILISAFLYSCVFFKVQIQHGMQISRNFYLSNTAKIEIVCVFITFATLAFFYIFRLTESSLWFDEGIEYWVSKSISGAAYGFVSEKSNMYERICYTIQPPLYNVLMFLWLKICDTEFWFKFFGVICFLVGNIAFFLSCREFTNRIVSCAFTLLFGLSHNFIYYAHEAAEYTCLFCFICWMMLFFLRCIKNFSWKNAIGYFTFAVLSIYSQYGASFVIAGTGLILFLQIFFVENKDERKVRAVRFFSCALVSVVVFVLPLFVFFMKVQLFNGSSGVHEGVSHSPTLKYGNFLVDYVMSFFDSVGFFFSVRYEKILRIPFLALLATLAVIFIKKRTERNFALISLSLFVSWSLYYVAVRFHFYEVSYTEGFGNRWGMAFCALYGIFFVYMTLILIRLLRKFFEQKNAYVLNFLSACCFVFLCFSSIRTNLNSHDIKEDVRDFYEAVSKDDALKNMFIISERCYEPTFMFYTVHDKDSEILENFHSLPFQNENESLETVCENFKKILGSENPNEFLFYFGDEPTNEKAEMEAVSRLGYEAAEEIQYSEKKGGKSATALKFKKR